jgi:hypothetical protein
MMELTSDDEFKGFKDFNGSKVSLEAFEVFVSSMLKALTQLKNFKEGPNYKEEKLHFHVSKQFMNLANSLRLTIPDINKHLPDLTII